jgi:transposase
MEQSTRFIGMDVHKDTIVVAVTAAGDVGKATAYGTFPNTAAAVEKLVRRFRQAGGGPLKFCYEAGPVDTVFTAPSPGWGKTALWSPPR